MSVKHQSGSFPLLGILGLIFITLKLMGYIDWSWWWVLAPFWAGFAIVAILMGAAALFVGILALLGGRTHRVRRVRRW